MGARIFKNNNKQPRGYVHIYFGDGAYDLPLVLGLAMRAAGASLKVGYFYWPPNSVHEETSLLGVDFVPLDKTSSIISSNIYEYDMIILACCDKIHEDDLIKLISERPANTELVLCGHSFSAKILEIADLVSEVRCFHGVARKPYRP